MEHIMPQLVITVHENGSLETLLKDKVLDTRIFGDRRIERITIIEHDEYRQKFFIHWLKGPMVGTKRVPIGGGSVLHSYSSVACWDDYSVLFFDTYDDAVRHEVDSVNALRVNGYSFT
jgi:hypothetical protein